MYYPPLSDELKFAIVLGAAVLIGVIAFQGDAENEHHQKSNNNIAVVTTLSDSITSSSQLGYPTTTANSRFEEFLRSYGNNNLSGRSQAPDWDDFSYDDPSDLDCEDIGQEIWVGDDDPNGLDRDGDGWGCEGW